MRSRVKIELLHREYRLGPCCSEKYWGLGRLIHGDLVSDIFDVQCPFVRRVKLLDFEWAHIWLYLGLDLELLRGLHNYFADLWLPF